MEYLIQFAQRDDIQGVVNTALASPSVQGIVLEVDPFWMYLWRLKSHYGWDRIERILEHIDYFWRRFGFRNPGLFNPYFDLNDHYIPDKPLDEYDLKNWRPLIWEDYRQINRFSEFELPIIVKICLLPPGKSHDNFLPNFQDFNLPIVFETRPPASLYANPKKKYRPLVGGISIGTAGQEFGTLGGILRDNFGSYYGLTCAHVLHEGDEVRQPAKQDSRYSSFIGVRCSSSVLHPSGPYERCNPYDIQNTVNEVDAAIIELDQDIKASLSILDIGNLGGITPRSWLTPLQEVEVTGRSSGNSTLIIGGLAVTYAFSFNGEKYCFKNLFELKWPSAMQTHLQSPIKPGDSGAWVCNPSDKGFNWCGMVMGGDRWQGYAIFSETIEDWWRDDANLYLEVEEMQLIPS